MKFKLGPVEIGASEDDEGGVTVITFRQALTTTAIVAIIAGVIWFVTLTQPPNAVISGLIATTRPIAVMMLGVVWLGAVLSWLLRDFRK